VLPGHGAPVPSGTLCGGAGLSLLLPPGARWDFSTDSCYLRRLSAGPQLLLPFFFFNLLSYLLGVVGGGCSQHCGVSFPTSTGGDPVSPFPRWVSGMAVLSLCLFAALDLCCVHSPAGSAVPSVSLPRQRLDVAAAAAAGGSILSSRMVCWELTVCCDLGEVLGHSAL